MIYSDINTNSKKIIATYMFADVLKSYKSKATHFELPYLITEYCWRLIEEDLTNIRKLLMENKSKYAVFGFNCDYSKHVNRKETHDFCKELNSVTAEKFRTIASWFNKPSIASPSADLILLFRAVLSEIKGLHKNYTPEVLIDETSFTISGGLYFVIYDALFILIYNAAKYGKLNSRLELGINIQKQLIHISITSEVNDNAALKKAENLINIALNSDFEDAHIVEGRSGIKKLRQMANDQYISDVNYQFHSNIIAASFNFKLDF